MKSPKACNLLFITACLWFISLQPAYCFYNATTGRWLSRDPAGERGGLNVMAFVHNNTPNAADALGLQSFGGWDPGTIVTGPLPGGSPPLPVPSPPSPIKPPQIQPPQPPGGGNTVHTATCDLCGSGPKLGPGTQTLQDWRWHVWDRTWQENTIQITPPGLGPVTAPVHLPLSGGYWVIIGGWVVVKATCPVAQDRWTLTAFVVNTWPSIGPDMKPSVDCVYTCGKHVVTTPGDGEESLPLPHREDSSDPNKPPAVQPRSR
jgi:hypothetical protein